MRIFAGAVFALSTLSLLGQSDHPSVPKPILTGWYRTGNDPKQVYQLSRDTSTKHGGTSSLSIKCETCSAEKPPSDASETQISFGSIIQQIKADHYRGKRIRFAAYLKTDDVGGGGAGL
ncbi:hypothetical protein [Occallatibacter savannae]|uniref:hypothetical protein n=1 Tax=Occallatibacter savannae TaxID=1002691 RepID=UPI000D691E96|nr:hypothetical protein [Occallatibacter savannae]